jgi:hypothetical protein
VRYLFLSCEKVESNSSTLRILLNLALKAVEKAYALRKAEIRVGPLHSVRRPFDFLGN